MRSTWAEVFIRGEFCDAAGLRTLLFRGITTERLRRGVFTSVPELVKAIEEYVAHHNKEPQPFIWTKSARDILQKVIRANSR